MHDKIKLLENKVVEVSNELHKIQESINHLKTKQNKHGDLNTITYFTYNIMMPSHKRLQMNIIGSFVIKNIGTVTLTNPFICLKFQPRQGFSLSGKIGGEEVIDREYSPVPSMETWSFLSDEASKKAEREGEYWLKPVNSKEVSPGESISFTNFHIRLDQENITSKFIGEGFVYSDEIETGQRSSNKINVYY